MNLKQIIKIIFAGIFTFFVIGSLSSISNSIFLEKIVDDLSIASSAKFNELRKEFFETQTSVNENKKILKVGLLAPFSGEYKDMGQSIMLSLQLALDEINDDQIKIFGIEFLLTRGMFDVLYPLFAK